MPGIAAFTSFGNGDTRSRFIYANRGTTLTGFCQRTITVGGLTAYFRQNFGLPLHQGWNPVVADFSIPQPSHVVANLKLGTGPHEKWYFFTPAAPWLWKPTPHGLPVPSATIGSSRASQSGFPLPPPSSPRPPPLETAAASAPPADPPIGASAIGCCNENNSVNAVDNAIAAAITLPGSPCQPTPAPSC